MPRHIARTGSARSTAGLGGASNCSLAGSGTRDTDSTCATTSLIRWLTNSCSPPCGVDGSSVMAVDRPDAAKVFQVGCITGRHFNDGRCLCAAEVRRLQANGLDEADAVALILDEAARVLRGGSGDAEDVRDDSTNDDFVFGHDNIISNESSDHSTRVYQIIGGKWVCECSCGGGRASTYRTFREAAHAARLHRHSEDARG